MTPTECTAPSAERTTRTSSDRPRNQLSPRLGHEERAFVFAVAMKYVKDEEAAADVAQEALLLAHRHRHKFRGDSRYSTWLYRVAASAALMHLRTRRRRAWEILEDRSERDPDLGVRASASEEVMWACQRGTPDQRLENKQAVRMIEERLAELGDKYQRIFWMRYLEGYTETEIAEQLELTLATVKTRAHRACVAVRETLRQAA